MASNAVATTVNGTRGLATSAPGDSTWDVMLSQANVLVRSGFLPTSIKTAEQAIAIMLTGDELGIPKMLALRSIVVINGKPTLSADLMVALVQRAIDQHGDGEFRVLPPTPEKCTVNYRRWGWSEGHSYTYTIQDAQRAGLAGKGTWAAHPAAMLRARATSAVCRMAFPDVISGVYTPDEATEFTPHPEGEARWGNVTVLPTAEDVQDSEAIVVEPEPAPTQPVNLNDDIKRLREQLGWSASDVVDMAKENGWNPRSREGLQAIHDRLIEYVDNVFDQAENDHPDTEIIDADYQPVMPGMPAEDRWTE